MSTHFTSLFYPLLFLFFLSHTSTSPPYGSNSTLHVHFCGLSVHLYVRVSSLLSDASSVLHPRRLSSMRRVDNLTTGGTPAFVFRQGLVQNPFSRSLLSSPPRGLSLFYVVGLSVLLFWFSQNLRFVPFKGLPAYNDFSTDRYLFTFL